MRILCIAALAVTAAGCAGRDAQQIATVQAQDANSDCAMVTAEIQANNKRAEDLASERGLKIAQNVAVGVVGIVVWPVLFGLDAKGAAGTEIDALKARQEYLTSLAAIRCAAPPTAQAPIVAAPVTRSKRPPKPAPVATAPAAATIVEAAPKPGT